MAKELSRGKSAGEIGDSSTGDITISYVGWLGHGNLGDEALYLVSRRIFDGFRLDPYVSESYGKITLLGGGTILPHWTLSVVPSKYNYAFGVGFRDPSFWGDFHPYLAELLRRFKFRLLGTRDYRTKELLRKWGIESKMVGDPCLLLRPNSVKRNLDIIAINFGTSLGRVWGGNEKLIEENIGSLCIQLKKEGYQPILVPFWEDDLPCIERVSRAAKVEVFRRWRDVQDTLDFIASSYVLIGQRLHSIVFSAASLTPFIALEYKPKCAHFVATLGLEEYKIRTDTFNPEGMMTLFCRLLANWDNIHESMEESVRSMRCTLKDFAGQIINDIESLPDKDLNLKSVRRRVWTIYNKSDIYFFNHFNSFWRVWNRLPARRTARKLMECFLA